jgi:hypothetical protein
MAANNHVDFANWQPQIIVIALGDNDFVADVKPGEK